MESQFFLIIRQLAMMFLLVVLGVILYRKDMLSDKTTKQISNLILYIVSPCITVVSFIQPYSTEKLIGFGVSLLYDNSRDFGTNKPALAGVFYACFGFGPGFFRKLPSLL